MDVLVDVVCVREGEHVCNCEEGHLKADEHVGDRWGDVLAVRVRAD